MPFATIKEHRDFFSAHQRIEFEHLLTEEQCQFMQQCMQLDNARDLWRRHAVVKKIVFGKNLAQIAAELVNAKQLRIAYDQVLGTKPNKTLTLAQASCVQGIACGWVFCVKTPTQAMEETPHFFPLNAGSGVFFSAETPIPFEELSQLSDALYLLVAYADKRAVYIHQPEDPHLHAWKEMGLAFGDRLRDDKYPLIYP